MTVISYLYIAVHVEQHQKSDTEIHTKINLDLPIDKSKQNYFKKCSSDPQKDKEKNKQKTKQK